jgi:hypothetical protein
MYHQLDKLQMSIHNPHMASRLITAEWGEWQGWAAWEEWQGWAEWEGTE